MRKTIIAGLLAVTTLVPTIAQAQISPQERHELRRDREQVREERRELDDARRFGNQRDIREERRDLREARQELREDRRDIRGDGRGDWRGNGYGYGNRNYGRNDWRGYREQNRNLYRNQYNYGFRYQQFRPGLRIQPQYFGQRYVIGNPYDYRLPRAGFHQRWVRHYNDVVLVDDRRGIVIDVFRGIFY